MEPAPSFTSALEGVLEESRSQARDQLAAAWQLYVSRVEEQLRNGWEENVTHLLDERFQDLSSRLTGDVQESIQQRFQQEIEKVRIEERRGATRRLTETLSSAARRLRQAARQDEWSSALVDGGAKFAPLVAVFTVQGDRLRLERGNVPTAAIEIPIADAPALAQCVNNREPVVATKNPREISALVADVFAAHPGPRTYSFPIECAGKTVGVLYAEGGTESVDLSALELLASLGSAVWEARVRAQAAVVPATAMATAAAAGPSSGLVAIQQATAVNGHRTAAPRPAWSDLSAAEQDLHLKAQRFARVQVAEIRLFKSQAVKEGRQARALYLMLKDDIERGKESFQRQYVEPCPSMVDYFHIEMVRTLANDNEDLLGADYPGPIV